MKADGSEPLRTVGSLTLCRSLLSAGLVDRFQTQRRRTPRLSGMKSRVQRARRQLKALMTECCHITIDRRGTPTDVQPRGACACT
jgi:hypothetical protein